MKRDLAIDFTKGFAILLVYLGHSILYYPIQMNTIYPWCRQLDFFISSFNMPLFFIISGFLFAYSKKDNWVILKNKVNRLLIPYISTMFLLISVKLMLPSSLSFNKVGDISHGIQNAFFYGGDRWFVYVLFIMFLLLIPLKKYLHYREGRLSLVLIPILIGIYYWRIMPNICLLNKVFYYMIFFLIGFYSNSYYNVIKQKLYEYRCLILLLVLLTNVILIKELRNYTFIFKFILPLIGSIASFMLAFVIEKKVHVKNKIVAYVNYCGKYSLQMYLMSFAFPIIRHVIVNTLHIQNSYIIVLSVFILQLICITILIEITKRIKGLRFLFGY